MKVFSKWNLLIMIFAIYIFTFDGHVLEVSKAVWTRGEKMEKVLWIVIMTVRQIDQLCSPIDAFIDFIHPLQKEVNITLITGNPRSGTTNLQNSANLAGATLEDILFPSISSKILFYPLKLAVSRFMSVFTNTPNHEVNGRAFIEEQFWLVLRFKSAGTVSFFPSILSDESLLNQTMALSVDDIDYIISNARKILKYYGKTQYLGATFFTIPYHNYFHSQYGVRFIVMKRNLHSLFPSVASMWTKIWTNLKYDDQIESLTLFYLKWTSDNAKHQMGIATNEAFYVIESNIWFQISENEEVLKELENFLGAKLTPMQKQESHQYDDIWKYWKHELGKKIIAEYLSHPLHFDYI